MNFQNNTNNNITGNISTNIGQKNHISNSNSNNISNISKNSFNLRKKNGPVDVKMLNLKSTKPSEQKNNNINDLFNQNKNTINDLSLR